MSHFPYPGLRPFKREETDIFFGRDELSNQLVDKLDETYFLAVIGVSGCGKSSLVRTGMLASLERGFMTSAGSRWRIAELHPGNSPFANLAEALLQDQAFKTAYTAHLIDETEAPNFLEAELRRGPLSLYEILQISPLPSKTNLLIVVDQFEELFRTYYQRKDQQEGPNQNEAIAFVQWLLASSKYQAVYVVITMRSEFIGECTKFSGLPEAINKGQFLTPRLTREQLQEAIEGPAKLFGGEVEPLLTNHLLNEISQHNYTDQLSVLQHALMQMWLLAKKTQSQPIQLTIEEHYTKIGQLKNALSNHADAVYEELNAKQQEIARILFINLCDKAINERHDIRRPIALGTVAELAEVPWQQVVPIVEKFRQPERLFLTPWLEDVPELQADTQLDVSHESFIRLWKNLQEWLEEESISAETYCRLEQNARLWKKGKTGLLQTPELEHAFAWFDRKKPSSQWASRYGSHFELAKHFLLESKAEHNRKQKQKQEQIVTEIVRLKELKRARRQRAWAFIGIVIIAILAGWALITEQKRTVELFESKFTHAELLALGENYAEAKKQINQTYPLDSNVNVERRHARNLLNWFTQLMGGESQPIYQRTNAPLLTIATDSVGKKLAAAGEKGSVVLFDTHNDELSNHLEGHDHNENVNDIVFHPQKQWLVSAGDDKKIIFWSLEHKKPLKQWKTEHPVSAMAVSHDGQWLAIGEGEEENNNIITLKNIETEQSQNPFQEPHKEDITSLAFSPDGKLLASASGDGTARLWEIKTGKLLQTLNHDADNEVYDVSFSPDGQQLATGTIGNTVVLWDVKSGQLLKVLYGHGKDVHKVRFINNDRLVSASRDSTLRVWDIQSGVTLRVLQGHTASVSSIATFGEQIFSASNDGTVRRWNGALPYQQWIGLPSKPMSTAIAPHGDQIAVGFADGSLCLYVLPKSQLLCDGEKAHLDLVRRLTFNCDGTLLASASYDKTAKVWQVKNHKLQALYSFVHNNPINAISFSPDNRTLITGSLDGQIGLFNLDTKQDYFYQVNEENEEIAINSVSVFSEKGKQWLLSTSDYDIQLWNIKNWTDKAPTLLETYPNPSNDYLGWASISPDGQQIASVGRDQVVHIYSTTNQFEPYSLPGHESTIFRVIFSPDSQQIATVSADATLRFWDLGNRNELFSLRLPTDDQVPLWDFDFRCISTGCWVAVPLTRGQLILYKLGDIYHDMKSQ